MTNIIIKTVYECTALPVRWYDWTAVNVADGEIGEMQLIGYGDTEGGAIDDLVAQINERVTIRQTEVA